MKNQMQKLNFYLLILLFVFLPFSSWLVSLTGSIWVSLFRDLLVAIIFICAFIYRENKATIKVYYLPVVLFVLWVLSSVFWRDAGFVQWTKGARLLIVPLILFVSLQWVTFSKAKRDIIYKFIICSSIVVVIFALLELFGVKIPLTTVWSGNGALEADQMVGALNISRVSSILAGPNALGLYLLVLIAVSIRNPIINKYNYLLVATYTIFLILTFSRSALLGLLVLLFGLSFFWLYKKKGLAYSLILVLTTLILLFSILFIFYQNPKTKSLLTHDKSSSLRVEQYQRIWNQRYEIGLLGHGTGTAGPSSQLRLDGGENHWTENTYLDIFEELGLLGLFSYLAIVLFVLKLNYVRMNVSNESKIAFFLSLSFLITGVFINVYTGQVAIFLFWLFNGLTIKEQYGKNTN